MADLLFLTDGVGPQSAEQSWISRLEVVFGHTVNDLQKDSYTTAVGAPYDGVILGQSISALNNADLVASPKPVLMMGTQAPVEFGLTSQSNQFFISATQIDILDSGNPLSAGLPTGLNTVSTGSFNYYRSQNSAPAAALAYGHPPDASPTRVVGYSLEAGELLFDGVTTNPGKRITTLGYTDTTMSATFLNAAGLSIIDAAFNELVGGVVVTPKLDGTLTPWDTQVPAANLTGVKYSVRSDLQTSDNQVLSGTTTTNASGQFTIEDAALSALTTYYVTFENAAGTVFATHKITTD